MTDEQVTEAKPEQQTQQEGQQEQQPQDNQQAQEQQNQQENQQTQGTAGKYLLQHNRPDCIGCAACEAVAPEFWEMHEDGKSDIKGGKNRDDGWQELDIEEKNFEANKEAADSCPVNVIHIVKKETGEKII